MDVMHHVTGRAAKWLEMGDVAGYQSPKVDAGPPTDLHPLLECPPSISKPPLNPPDRNAR